MKFKILLLTSMALACSACAAADAPQADATPTLTHEEMAQQPIIWERPVIIYSKSLGRERALRLRELLQPYFGEGIGLYPCEKEAVLEVPLPPHCTRIFL